MKRQILFRGKSVDTGKWLYGDLATAEDERDMFIATWNKGSMTGYKVNPETVGQFVGLYDRHKIMIFEGDIVRLCKSDITMVKWDEKNAAFQLFNPAWDFDDMIVLWVCGKREVIGNIHDNPELAPVKKRSAK